MNNWMVMSVISRNHHALHQLFISQRKKEKNKKKKTKEENRSSADERNLKWRGSWHDGVYMEMTIKPNTTISFDCRHRSTKRKKKTKKKKKKKLLFPFFFSSIINKSSSAEGQKKISKLLFRLVITCAGR